ncbi:hypothetical protein [Chitinibacter sp. ZOR0017]|uniref:hypothetical protein n=1 Tax=Chitinibacter sp. ZOR0017 TaxID=1339254 RepID=UPI00064839BE|nr:hypothetical protein [Chitinibacter sp. ZOR0017]
MKIFRDKPLFWHHQNDADLEFIDRFLIKIERERPDFNRRMFNEDFTRSFDSMNHRGGTLFEIVSNDNELMQKLLGNVKTRNAPHLIDKSIRELIVEIAESLIWNERAYFFLLDDTVQETIHVVPFSSSGVVRLLGTDIQWIPKRRERHWDRDDEEHPREIRILDAAKVMRFVIPTSLKHMLSAQNRTLALLDKNQHGGINFYAEVTHENPNPTNHFDFRVWKDTQERALYRATRKTGWSGRNYDSTKRSDFFDCHRLIRFRRNQLLLRDDILNQLSVELSRVGKGYNSEFSVEISATDELPNVAHLNELEVRLAHEEVGFNEIIDYCYNKR